MKRCKITVECNAEYPTEKGTFIIVHDHKDEHSDDMFAASIEAIGHILFSLSYHGGGEYRVVQVARLVDQMNIRQSLHPLPDGDLGMLANNFLDAAAALVKSCTRNPRR